RDAAAVLIGMQLSAEASTPASCTIAFISTSRKSPRFPATETLDCGRTDDLARLATCHLLHLRYQPASAHNRARPMSMPARNHATGPAGTCACRLHIASHLRGGQLR